MPHPDRDAALDELRGLGVVHVTDRRPPAGDELEALRARLAGAERALAALPEKPERAAAALAARGRGRGRRGAAGRGRRRGGARAARPPRRPRRPRRRSSSRELARYAGFGEFELGRGARAPARRRLDGAGRARRRTSASRRRTAWCSRSSGATAAAGASCSPSLGGRPDPLPDLGGHYELVPWPERPLADLRDEVAAAEAESDAAARRLEELAAARGAVAALARATADQTRWAEVRAGMDEAGELSVLSGYVPAAEQDAVREAAAAHGWGILLDDPQPGEDVPIQLHQSRWVRPISTVFDFLHIYPGYWEADAGWVILPFFSLFFAMIVGDAGYAILLLMLTAVLQWRLKKVPAHVFHMMYIVGFATLVWGVLSGSYFGIPTLPRFAAAAPGGLARRPRQPHRPLLPHRRGAPLVRPRLERGRRSPARGPGPRWSRRAAGCSSCGRCSSSPGRPSSAAALRASCC